MTTTHNPTTWRDLADQLTPDRAAGIERLEGHLSPEVRETAQARQALLDVARDEVRRGAMDARYAGVPLPAGASPCGESWGWNAVEGCVDRAVEWASFDAGHPDADVLVDGRQRVDGGFTAQVSLYCENAHLTADQARALASALQAAADRLDDLADAAWSEVPVCCSEIPCPHRDEPPFM